MSIIYNTLQKVIHDYNSSDAIALFSPPDSNEVHFLYDRNFKTKKTVHKKFKTDEEGFYIIPFRINKGLYGIIKPETYLTDTIGNLRNINSDDKSVLDKLSIMLLKGQKLRKINCSDKDFLKSAKQLIRKMKAEKLRKIVLAMSKVRSHNGSINLIDKFLLMRNLYPNNYISLHYTPEWGVWLGASPEMITTLDKEQTLKTVALAGTKIIGENQTVDDVLWSFKEIEEQAMVSRYIINCFKKIRFRFFDERGPYVIQMGNLAHLKTNFIINRDSIDDIIRLENDIINLLHPTSAVCGMPKDIALRLLRQYESFDRSLFAGALGLTIKEGSAMTKQFFVNIRCVRLFDTAYQLFAGAGLTKSSVPSDELTEVKNKMSLLERCFN